MYKEELLTFFLAMIPVSELRGAIPIAISVFGMSPLKAFIIATLGNILPNIFLLAILEPLSQFLIRHNQFAARFLQRIFKKTRGQHSQKFARYGALFLVIFVAIPLPGSGSWTGSLLAFLFGIPYLKALALISLGILIAGIIITLSVSGIFQMLAYF